MLVCGTYFPLVVESMLIRSSTGPLDKGQKAEFHGCVRHSQAVVMPEGVLF
jgi:hypothetical protein